MRQSIRSIWHDEFTMSRRVEIAEQALTLPPEDRAYIADLLEQSLPEDVGWTPEVAEAWSREIDRRVAAYDRGETTAIDVETSLENMRQALAQIRASRASQ
jgi:putative addiction module component (TIGR02574 family)